MSSPAVDIAGLLNAVGIGTSGTNLFVGRRDDLDVLTIHLLDVGGPGS